MNRLPRHLFTLFIITTSTVVSAAPSSEEKRPTFFKLDGRPEGIVEGPGSQLWVGEILTGAVVSIDATDRKKKKEIIPPNDDGRQTWGLAKHGSTLFVGGGGEVFGGGRPELYVYDVKSGELITTCSPKRSNDDIGVSFINDIAIHDDNGYAYITDSFHDELMVVDAKAAMQGDCKVSSLALPDIFEASSDADWGANGIVPYGKGLLVAHETDGSVWYVPLKKNDTPTQIIASGDALGADGLNVLDDKLYVTQNTENKIGVYELSGRKGKNIKAVVLGSLESPYYDTPTLSALYDGYIYTVVSRLLTVDIEEEADDLVVGVRNYFDDKCYD